MWAIHPLHTSAVVYVSGRADPLAAACGFLGLFFGIRSLAAIGGIRWLLLFTAGVLFLFSALSKEIGLIFPVLWCAIGLVRKRRNEIVTAVLLLVATLTLYSILRLTAEHVPAPRFRAATRLASRPAVAARACAEYAALILFPINLHMERDVSDSTNDGNSDQQGSSRSNGVKTAIGVLVAGAFVYWLIRSWTENNPTFTCLVMAILAYLPISGVFPLNATVAEHWIYIPTAFVFLAASITISQLRISKPIVATILGAWLLFLGVRTWIRTLDWKDQRTFLQRTMANGGESARMLVNLAGLELKEQKLDLAKEHLTAAWKKEPDQPLVIINLASLAVLQNDLETARRLLDRAATIPFIAPRAYELLAVLNHRETGQIDLSLFQLAARKGPPNWSIERRYIQALDQSGSTNDAIAELKSCLETQWYRAESWQFLGELLTKVGQKSEAIEALRRAKAYDVHLGHAREGGSTP